jgi:D-amino-acid dehydrogenase
MKVLVLGAGITGIPSAWYLAQQGHEVIVLDRQKQAGLETTYANGAQISVSYAEPWANPGMPLKLLKWLGREDSPLLFRLKMDPEQWKWGLRFLWECLPDNTRSNTVAILALALYSRNMLQELRKDTGIEYEHLERGIMTYYTGQADYEDGLKAAKVMREFGCERNQISLDEAMTIEPALKACRDRLAGVLYTPSDETGDAFVFTQKLAQMCRDKGVKIRYGIEVQGVRAANESGGSRVTGVVVKNENGEEETIQADAYLCCMGSYAPLLVKPLGVNLLIYPTKGYSATLKVKDPEACNHVSLTDDAIKIVFSRLGDRLRIAGTAEHAGYNLDLNMVRCEALVKRGREMFPEAAYWDEPQYWTGLRPATPSNVPYIGQTKVRNLYLNTGHGTLGWTMGCGSGKAIADIISSRAPEVQFPFMKG